MECKGGMSKDLDDDSMNEEDGRAFGMNRMYICIYVCMHACMYAFIYNDVFLIK